MTRDEGIKARNDLFNDPAWYADWIAGKPEAKAKFDTICEAITGDRSNPQPLPEAGGRQGWQGREITKGSEHWRGDK